MTEAYGAFAYAYDRALGARFFRAVRTLLDQTLERYPTPRRPHLDVACGTGLALAYFRERGFRSVGVDASLSMLRGAAAVSAAVARGADGAAAAAPRIVAGDMRRLPLRRSFARVTCLYDSLNHLLDAADLSAAFRSIRGVMDDDSLLLFDMNHPDIYPEVWGLSDPYVASGSDFHLEIATTYRKRERIGRASVTGWATVAGQRVDIREQHRQRAYSEREIAASLDSAGLVPVDVVEFDPYDEARDADAPTVKLFYVARVA